VRNCGIRMVEVQTREEMEQAISERTALMLFLNAAEPKGEVRMEEFIAIGKKHGVPTFNDAAADVPPVDNLRKYTRLGFDLVTFSGGKGIRGPQSAGLLLGRAGLIRAARLNTLPNSDTIGRSCKVNKEELVGMLVALEMYLKRDHEAEWRQWEKRITTIETEVRRVPGVRTERFVPEIANHAPHLRIQWDETAVPLDREALVRQLREGEPSIEIVPGARVEGSVEVGVWMLEPGEAEIVGRRLRQVLSAAKKAPASE